MNAVAIALLALLPAAFASEPSRSDRSDWALLHGDLQRTGFYPQFPRGPLKLVWRKELWRELTGPRAEVIVADSNAFLGSYAGRVYAWDAATGEERWQFQTGGPIGHSPTHGLVALTAQSDSQGQTRPAPSPVLFVASMDRKLYALNSRTGQPHWSFTCDEGIWVSPTFHAGKVFFGDRAGAFRALDAGSGKLLWQFDTGAPILQTASISEDGEFVLFTSEDLHLHCLRVSDGKVLWKSRRLAGITARDYFPVLFRGLAFIATSPAKDFHATLDEHQQMLVARTGFTGKDQRYVPGTPEDVKAEQDFIVKFLREHPSEQTFYAFRVSDGSEPWIAPILYTGGLHNPMTPPACNPQTGEVFTQVRSAYTTWDGGGEVRAFTGFGRLDLATGRVALLDHGYPSKDPARPAGDKDKPWGSFNYIGDETQALACAPGLLINTHQGNLGVMDLKTGKILNVFGKRDSYGGFYGGANFGWENQGGREKAKAAGQPYGLVNEWHGPARAIVSVAGGRAYFHVGSQVLCLEPQATGGKP